MEKADERIVMVDKNSPASSSTKSVATRKGGNRKMGLMKEYNLRNKERA